MDTLGWILLSEMAWGAPFLVAFFLPKRHEDHAFTFLKISLLIAPFWVLFWLVQLWAWLSQHLCY